MSIIRTYTDATGRTQRAVDGPNGTYLITRKNDSDPFAVWKSDSLNTQGKHRDPAAALEHACRLAGVDL